MSNAYTPFTSISVKTSTDVTHARSVIIEFGHAIEPIPIPLIRNEATRGVEMTPSSSVSASRSKFMCSDTSTAYTRLQKYRREPASKTATTSHPAPYLPLHPRHAHSHSFASAAEVVSSPIASLSSIDLATHSTYTAEFHPTQSTSALLVERRKDTLLGLKCPPLPPPHTIGLGDRVTQSRN
uniref:Uncharacterized protein n=1 Tax=Moniliophthora roreri TaxID=221103 RepID=A0A0W0FNS4_MONRR